MAQSAPVQAAQAQVERRDPDPIGVQSSVYAVSGVALGATVQFDSSAFKEYKCIPSDQFDGFTWCQKTRQQKERRGKFNATYSILHSGAGAAAYIDRYQEPAFFGAREADDDIRGYSRKIGETPRITRMPQRAGFPNGILASWGRVELEPLDNDSIEALAEGGRPTTTGYFIDFIGDLPRSAKEGLPIYRITGGAGFVWVASFDQRGRGTLRLTAVDASAFAPTTTPRAPSEGVDSATEKGTIANSINQVSRPEAEKESVAQARMGAERAPGDPEKAHVEAVRPETDFDEATDNEQSKLDAVLEAQKSAVETSPTGRLNEAPRVHGGGMAVSATAQLTTPPTQATRVNPPQIKVVRAKPIDPAVPELRFQLSDSSVDLMKAFSLGGFEGIGGAWKIPPPDEPFDARFGRW